MVPKRPDGCQAGPDLDASIADTGYGLVIGVPLLLTTLVGVAPLVPNDAGSDPNTPNANPRFAELPRGIAGFPTQNTTGMSTCTIL